MNNQETLKALSDRLFDGNGEWMAAYLGVPKNTARNWIEGTREPPAAVMRLVEVLGIVEAMVPDLHQSLMPAPPAPKRKPGRPAEGGIGS